MPTGGLKQQWFANMPRIDGGWLARKAREDARPCQRQQQRSSSARSAGRRWHWHERSVLCALHAIGRPNLPLCYVHIRVFCAAPAPPPAGRRVCCRLQDSCCSTDAGPSSNGEPFNNEVNNEGPDQQQSAWLAITTAAAAAGGSSDRKKWHLDSQHRPALDLESTRDCWVRAHNHWSTAVLFEHAFTGPGNLNKIK